MYKKGKVHPSTSFVADHLSLLPAVILALAAALSTEEKEILAYLISCSGGNTNPDSHRKRAQKKKSVDYLSDNGGGGVEHDPIFECNCFNCYLSYWARWDISPNRQVIHEIIEAYEEWLLKKKKKSSKKKEKTKQVCNELKGNPERNFEKEKETKNDFGIGEFELGEKNPIYAIQDVDLESEKSLVRKISSFVGQKIWGFLG